jgi:carboxyl-terminal processing protease
MEYVVRLFPRLAVPLASLLLGFAILGVPTTIFAKTTDGGSDGSETGTINLPLEDVQRLATVIAELHKYYIDPVDDKKLFNSAISGMVANLDPHSDFLDEDALRDLETTTTGKFDGIGIEVMPSDGFIKVISPIDGTPSYKAGIKGGDLIVRIDHKLVRDMTLREAINMIRGPSGSVVHLTIIRKNAKKPLEFAVTREVIKLDTVRTELLQDGYGYIRLSFFQESTAQDLIKKVKQLQSKSSKPLKGVVLDLRDNPGGLLDASVDVTNLFLDSKRLNKYSRLIVYTKGRIPNADVRAFATGTDMLKGIPMVVLINENTASAAEIVSGALKDYKRATLVGHRTFGKGSVQTILPVDEKSALKLTTALYYTPSGVSIQARGIEPDIDIPDIVIPKPTDESADDDDFSIAESDLKRHLNNVDGKNDAAAIAEKIKENDKKIQVLLYSDFQLLEALNVLKGLQAGKAG